MAQAPALGGASLGLFEGNHTVRLLNGYGGAIVAGDILQISKLIVDANTLAFTTAIAVADPMLGLFAVALEDIPDSATAEGKFLVRGYATCLLKGATTIGLTLAVDATETLDIAVAGEKAVAVNLVATTGAGLAMCYFNGIEGLGHFAAT